MSVRKIVLLFAGLIVSAAASAQFYSGGEDPASVRWSVSRSAHYKLIYPRGMDSLARVYARYLEYYRPLEAPSSGYLPGGMYRRPLPVVLHAFGGSSNGSVAWAPMRMDLYTLPEAYGPEPLPWTASLAVHENRHVSQMQFGADGWFKPFKWLTGELFAGAMAGIYPGSWFLEGDAVVAETALTPYGRGRRGDFLNYYRAAFDQGDWRNWYRWRHGSWRRYAPNHYALGYLTLAGARYLYDEPLFTADYLRGAARHPLRLRHIQRAFRRTSGKKFQPAFRDIMQTFQDLWTAENRGPWTPGEALDPAPAWYTVQASPLFFEGSLARLEHSKIRPTRLILRERGKERRLPFSSATGDLRTDGKRLYWSETVPDLRWGLAATSRIRYREDGKTHDLTRSGRLYNPAPSPDGSRIAAVEYPVEGGTRLVLLDRDGNRLQQIPAPDGVQYVETAWSNERLYLSFIAGDGGSGIARWDGAGVPETLLAPQAVSIAHLQGTADGLLFNCDRTGVGEIYRLAADGTLYQLTATPYGAADFTLQGDTLWYSAQTRDGVLLHKTAALADRPVDFAAVAPHPVADKLSAQEKALTPPVAADTETWSEAKPFRKFPGIFHIHSWAPVYFDYDRIEQLSGDVTWREAGIGATALFQNLLGTSSGSVGYSVHKDADGRWRHAGRFQMTYTGLYPVLELSADIGDRDLFQYRRVRQESGSLALSFLSGQPVEKPSFRASLRAYVPLNFSRGGWHRGLIPQVSYTFTNDRFNKSLPVLTVADPLEGSSSFASLSRLEPGDNVFMQRLTLSVRGYQVLGTAASQEYPSLGIGAETGWQTRLGLDDLYSNAFFAYLYGYLPGLFPAQGLRLTATYQHQSGAPTGENAISAMPRGFQDSRLSSWLAAHAPEQVKLTADYAIPFSLGEWSAFSPLFYVTHFVVKPHADVLTFAVGRGFKGHGTLLSAGAEVTARLANFLWLPYETAVGFTFDWNGGPDYDFVAEQGTELARTWIGGVFTVDF